MNRALVTGGAGFIGSHLCDELLELGWEVWALDDLSTGSAVNVQGARASAAFHLVVDTVLRESVVNELTYSVDVVFHLAAVVGVRLIVDEPVRTLVTNVQGTEVVLDIAARFGKRVVLASTSEVYGDHRTHEPLGEDSRRVYGPTTSRRWGYADAKALDELLAFAYRDERSLDCVVARLFNTTGPRQSSAYGMVLPRFVKAALAGAPLEVYGNGEQVRSFCHVSDTVNALVTLAESGPSGEVFNVGRPEPITMLDLAKLVCQMTGSKSEIAFVPYEQVYGAGMEDMEHRVPVTTKIENAIGWRAERTLEEIVAELAGAVQPVR